MKKNETPMLPPSERLAALERNGIAPAAEGEPARMTLQWLAVTLALSQQAGDVKEGRRLRMDAIKTGLGFDTAPTLEKLLIEQIALCWLRLGEAEAKVKRSILSSPEADEQRAQIRAMLRDASAPVPRGMYPQRAVEPEPDAHFEELIGRLVEPIPMTMFRFSK